MACCSQEQTKSMRRRIFCCQVRGKVLLLQVANGPSADDIYEKEQKFFGRSVQGKSMFALALLQSVPRYMRDRESRCRWFQAKQLAKGNSFGFLAAFCRRWLSLGVCWIYLQILMLHASTSPCTSIAALYYPMSLHRPWNSSTPIVVSRYSANSDN